MPDLGDLSYGSLRTADGPRRAVARMSVGGADRLLDLTTLEKDLFGAGTLDAFLAAGRSVWSQVNAAAVAALRSADGAALRSADGDSGLSAAPPVLAFDVADYVDFYASEHHATNVGRIFRPDGDALTPNWKHLPIGYHGRAGTVVASGTDIRRPVGQARNPDASIRYGPSRRLDIEAEVGFVVGTPSAPREPVRVDAFADHVFGVCLLNDWSARDIQAWEYVPLGPFLGKSFATSVAAWITPLDVLVDAWTPPPAQDPRPLPYLSEPASAGLDLELRVVLNGAEISRPCFAGMYWTPAQLLAHLTSNGAHLRTGDLFASGTVSGPAKAQRGCLLELTWGGTEPLTLPDGSTRTFLEDGDEVVITATAPSATEGSIALGEVRGRVSPARD
jgi:fumarylacetoacetase